MQSCTLRYVKLSSRILCRRSPYRSGFNSGSHKYLQSVVNDACDDKTVIHLGENENAKTLGIIWCPKSDVLQYKLIKINTITRSQNARCFRE
nr:unnamed protein product [Callosobruchus chinensis]